MLEGDNVLPEFRLPLAAFFDLVPPIAILSGQADVPKLLFDPA